MRTNGLWTVPLADTVAHRVKDVDVQSLYFTLAKVDAERLIYALADKLRVVEEEKFCNTLAKVKCKAVLDTLPVRETDVLVHILGDTPSELKGIETLDKLSDTVGGSEVELLGDTQVKINAKVLDYLMAYRQAKVKAEKLGDSGQRRK